MLEIAFVMARKQNHFFVEIVSALRLELDRLGVPSQVSLNGFPPPRPGLVYMVVPPHEYFVLEGEPEKPSDRLLSRTIFLCAEQPSTAHFDQNVGLARRAGAVFDINSWAAAEYSRRGIRAAHLPLGYSRYWDRFEVDDERDIDIVFLGCSSPRRDRSLASYSEQLQRLRTYILLTDNSGPNYSAKANFLLDNDKLRLLKRSKVVLNIHQGMDPYFEWQRVLEAIHCGCAIVTEHSIGYAPLVSGDHFVPGRPEVLGTLAREVVEDDGLRRTLRTQAYEFIRNQMPLERSAQRLVEAAIQVDSAAAVSAGVEASNGAPRHWTTDDDFLAAELPAAIAEPDTIGMALKEIRLDLMDVRRELNRNRLTQLGGALPPAVRRVWASPVSLVREPRVSVICALYNHADTVLDALTSVERGTFPDFELVVVDDGSSDSSLDDVERWGRANPQVPLVLLNHPVNRGLPQARNTGLDFARGEYVFILDSDNELLATCLERLVACLDRNQEATFAYGILACFGADGYSHLISKFPWDPARLRHGNYIDAMALFRKEHLRDMGGFTTDRRLYGWEDYDLYCRLAEAGRSGAFVPELLARYRVSPSSMLSITNLSWTAARAALLEHCPNLMSGASVPALHAGEVIAGQT